MKKIFLVAIMALVSMAYVNAQPRAVGSRLGYGVEFSYEHTLGKNMLSLDAGIVGFSGLEATVTYDWIDPCGTKIPWDEKGEWHWYTGLGAGVGFTGWSVWKSNYFYSFVGVAGRLGIEYDFEFPFQLSLDWRPLIGPGFVTNNGNTNAIFNTVGLYAGAICLGVRYKF